LRPRAPRPRPPPGAIVRSNCGSGPTPRGKRLTTIMKKKSVASTSVLRRHARSNSRHTSHRNIEGNRSCHHCVSSRRRQHSFGNFNS
jgi:hypothetical protein